MSENETIQYIRRIQGLESGVLGEIQREALNEGMPVIPPETARFLSVLLAAAKPVRALEIGCAVGFSAGFIAKRLPPHGRLLTIDRYETMIARARENFKRLGITHMVTLIEEDAGNILPRLDDRFDFIFLDAAKGQYNQFLPDILRLLAPGGLFVADDVLQGGTVAKSRLSVPRRQRTIHSRMDAFLVAVEKEPTLQSSIVPIGGGLLVAYKRS